ncbi:hypothetical protein CA984_24785 [Streptosporangium minutum]|uniref:Uncharacterized protein n=2 Tax=Streptosporangium minutum TaxID=569862 RepID=A0A243RGL7_9ACTN|nr:hypothetical protein CA984_24785 [Streptosporangium minutum]
MQWVLDPESRKPTNCRPIWKARSRTIGGGCLYASGLYSLPAGKTWARSARPGTVAKDAREAAGRQTAVNVFDPAASKTLLRRATVKPASGGFFRQGTLARPKVSRRLRTDGADLPKRLLTDKHVTGTHRLATIERREG